MVTNLEILLTTNVITRECLEVFSLSLELEGMACVVYIKLSMDLKMRAITSLSEAFSESVMCVKEIMLQ